MIIHIKLMLNSALIYYILILLLDIQQIINIYY